MLCKGCSRQKLRREFPHENVCKNQHAQLYCLRCVAKSIEVYSKCPVCDDCVRKSDSEYFACVQKLNWLFPPFEDEEAASARSLEYERDFKSLIRNITINVVMLNGDKNTVTVSRSCTIVDLKKTISILFGIDSKKQRLIYNDKSIQTYQAERLMKVSDYNITSNGTITLIKVLKTISDTLRHVTFDFSWEYTGYRRDFLNASAVLYSGSTRVDYVDFKNRRSGFLGGYLDDSFGAVTHSGHGFKNNRYGKRGRHILEVDFPKLNATNVDKVFFTLSALNAESIEDFRNLTLDFYDSRNPSEQLDEVSRAIQDYKAIVFCCLCRIDGSWQVFSLQEPSQGNVRSYYLLFYTIERLIQKGFS